MLVDIEAAVRSGKEPGYERWAKVFNLKQLSQAIVWLKEHGDMSYEDFTGTIRYHNRYVQRTVGEDQGIGITDDSQWRTAETDC